MKKLLLLFLILSGLGLRIFAIDQPNNPDTPKIDKDTSQEDSFITLAYQNQKGEFGKVKIKGFSGKYLKGLTWNDNNNGSQEILFDNIKSIRVKGYTMSKKTKDNLGVVFYFPYIFEITLKNGKVLENVKGRIQDIESIVVYNEIGKAKIYTYFVRFWLEDKQMFNDNKSTNYNEPPKVPGDTVIYLEFKKNLQ